MRFLALLVSLLMLPLSLQAHATAKVGTPAPEFTAIDSKGKTVKLSDYAGKIVVLEWTNDGCPFVKKHYQGNMQSLQRDSIAKDAVWLSVISSAPGKQGHVDGKKADALNTARGATPSAVLLDPQGTLGRLYDAKTTPHLFIVDARGTLAYAGGIDSINSADVGDIAKAEPYVKNAIGELLAGKPVSNAVTRPYGCSIKY